MADDAAPQSQKRPSERKSAVKEGNEPLTGALTRKASKKSEKEDEVIKKDAKPEPLPGDLAGTLQSLFTQTEQAEAPALKPLRRPKLIYENTFRLWPYKPFNNDKVQKVLEITLEEMLSKVKYKADTSNDLAMKVAEKVRARVLSFRFDRCKIIALVHIGPLFRQGLHVGMKCLWDPLRDSSSLAKSLQRKR